MAVRTLAEIIADLSREIPPEHLGTKSKGGRKITFFSWTVAQAYLDRLAPGWSGHATPVLSSERVACVYEICIPTSDHGLVCRAATGDDSEDEEDEPEFTSEEERRKWVQEQRAREYGSPITRAEGQAFKRAAARFGLGMYLRKGTPAAPASVAPAPPRVDPEARATDQQVADIYDLAALVAMSPVELRENLHVERLELLSERRAGAVINRLRQLAKEHPAPLGQDPELFAGEEPYPDLSTVAANSEKRGKK